VPVKYSADPLLKFCDARLFISIPELRSSAFFSQLSIMPYCDNLQTGLSVDALAGATFPFPLPCLPDRSIKTYAH